MLAALAAAAAAVSIQSPAPVQALAADGYRAAYVAGFSARDCNRVYVWNVRTSGVVKLGRRTHCDQTSTGNAVRSLALAGTRALWIHFAGGNRRQWTLWTATTSRPAPILLRSLELDVDDPAPFVLGEGDASVLGEILPYAAGETVFALRVNGARAFSWRAPARVTALGAGDGELAVATADGSVTVLDAAGRVVRRSEGASAPSAVFVTGKSVLVQRGRALEQLPSGRVFTLPGGARLQDGRGDAAVYVRLGVVHQLNLASGQHSQLARGELGQLEPGRTYTASGRTVTVR